MGCIHNINMGCCEPVLAPVENFYTKGQVDELIEEAVISGCCITPEEVDEKIEEAISGITVSGVTEERLEEAIAEVESEIPSIDGLASEEFVMDYTYDKQTIDDKVSEVESEIPSIDGLASEEFVTSYTYDKQTIDEKVASGGTFDPTQYYNKTQTNSLLDLKADTANTYTKTEVNSLVDSKADTTALTQVNNALTAHTANTTVHVTEADKNTWNNKQDTLISGTNIKTVNNQSLLGSGNIDIQGGGSTYTAGDGIDITNNVISTVTKFWCGDEAAYNQIAIKDINTIYLVHD